MEGGESADARGEVIEAPVTGWFYRRCLLLAVLLGGMGLYFCYDGFVGYPRGNHHADLYAAFEAGKNGDPAGEDSLEDVLAAHRAGADGTSWAAHAATLHLPSEPPQRHGPEEIRTQKRIAMALGIGALLAILWALMHRGRAWHMEDGTIRSPWGTKFAATSVTDIDRRSWDRGVALLISNDGDRFLRLKLDDYKYADAGRVILAIAQLHPEARIEPPLAADDAPESAENG